MNLSTSTKRLNPRSEALSKLVIFFLLYILMSVVLSGVAKADNRLNVIAKMPHNLQIIEVLSLANMISCESNVTGRRGMLLVADAILNRVSSRYYANSVSDVVSQENQFQPYAEGCRRSLRDPAHEKVVKMTWRVVKGLTPRMTYATMFVKQGMRPKGWDFDRLVFLGTASGHDWYAEKRVLREGIYKDMPDWLVDWR